MKISLQGKKEDVLSVVGHLLSSKTDSPWIMITHQGISEDYSVQIVTVMLLDDIARIKDLAF